ncbi:MAG TPA: response regulator [Microvirga sp.]|jgi:CheY-like chemotaxis protein|nr:response regulator [Microvirga sp.]
MIPILSLLSRPSGDGRQFPEPGRWRVLVVEDELILGAVAAEALEEAGFAVLTAASAEEAEVILSHEAVDVLFTDIDLGGRDGCDLAARALDMQPGLCVVFTSGRSRRYHESRLPAGAPFLAKPYRLSQLIDEIDRVSQEPSRR